MRIRSNLIVLLIVLALATGLWGCDGVAMEDDAGADAGVETEAVAENGTAGQGAEDDPLQSLEGSWDVSTVLTEIDNTMMTMAADQPGAVWDSVTVQNGTVAFTSYNSADQAIKHDYTGTIEADDGGWVIDAVATYADETGAMWTSTIEVHGDQTAGDTFNGTMIGSIDADTEGHLYKATWDVTGTRR